MKYLSPKQALCLYGTLLCLICIPLITLGDLFGNVILSLVLTVCVLLLGVTLRRRSRRSLQQTNQEYMQVVLASETEPNEDDQSSDDGIIVEEAESTAEPSFIPTPRLYYMDNLKSILTAIVVMHHSAGAFAAVGWLYMIGDYNSSFHIFGEGFMLCNQSYFMVLFFFFSGYMCPPSLKRKGTLEFVLDRYKRLFWPYLAFFVVLCPLLLYITTAAIAHQNAKTENATVPSFDYFPFMGHMWFVFWLLLFNLAYASMTDPENNRIERMQAPGPCKLLCGGLVLGMVQGLLIITLQVSTFASMPLTIGSLPFDIASFILGVRAKNQNWLNDDFSHYFRDGASVYESQATEDVEGVNIVEHAGSQKCRRRLLWILAFASAVICWAFPILQQLVQQDSRRGLNENENKQANLFGTMVFFAITGEVCVVFCVWWLMVGQCHLNYTTPLLSWISRSAYGVYMIHPFMVVPLTVAYVQILTTSKPRTSPLCFQKTHGHPQQDSRVTFIFGWVGSW